jgi:isopentenyl-diphosphate delta-isomerase
MGDQPLYINLGIAQIEQLLNNNDSVRIKELINKLDADGLIIHVNPMQEWLQPEGDRFRQSPIDTIKRVIDIADFKIIVKEVGQGMGPASLKSLLALPLEAIDFAANGGTNFALLEILRFIRDKSRKL